MEWNAATSTAMTEREENGPRKPVVLMDGPCSSSQQHQGDDQKVGVNAATMDKEIWREAASRMGVYEPRLYVTKLVTRTDASKDQNRYEISLDEVLRSKQLMELAVKANAGAVHVRALDKEGREYRLTFKYVPSNCRYRFMGSDWGRFMKDNGLQAGQTMRIWGLPYGEGGGDLGFAFVNSEK